ncbi:hypothetical protein [Roseibium sp. Sym1]|uniref:hypothetical protein n=1 Tax=Roseibium sp. Sym1 TaxID=3016006 RepID=UPI0022B5E09C|nr:hypothetical protein [Roseibium sp. Sym1]
MTIRALTKTITFLAALGCALPAAADPFGAANQPDLTAAKIVLASLQRDLEVPALPNMSPRISGQDIVQGDKTDAAPLIQLAGRCGSSNKYCNSPGFTYCCGNSTDGFYCAADVNGCTK